VKVRLLELGVGVPQALLDERVGERIVGAQVRALGRLAEQHHREARFRFPRVVGQARHPRPQVRESRPVRGRSLRLHPGAVVEARELHLRGSCDEHVRADVHVIGGLEGRVFEPRRAARLEDSPDAYVQLFASPLRKERVGGALHPVVDEVVFARGRVGHEEAFPGGGEQGRARRRLRLARQCRQEAEARDPSETCRERQELPGLDGELPDSLEQEIDHVLGDPDAIDLGHAPVPPPLRLVERQKAALLEGADELAEEERIAPRLVREELRQRRHAGRLGLESVAKKIPDGFLIERGEIDA
jgi:hypothetical protein